MTGPDLIFVNGRVSTLDPTNPEADCFTITDGRFTAVGRRDVLEQLGVPSTKYVDHGERRVIPGLNDSHTHLIRGGLNYNMELRWEGVDSLHDALALLKAQAAVTPAPQWVRVVGSFTMFQFKEQRLPTLDEINAAAPDTPVFILHLYDRALLNRAALRAVGYTKDTPEPIGGAFGLLWTATLLANVGTWMHDVAAGWLMTSLSPSPLVVALVQASTTAAVALFALPAGAMADLFDRKKLLIVLNVVRMVFAFLLAGLSWANLVDPWSLLVITFLLGVCSALIAPAWQAIVPSLVPRDILPQAIAMNSMGINVARAIGPAVAGTMIISTGVAAVFAVNALSELIIIAALLLWRPAPVSRRANPEQFLPAIVAGLRYSAASAGLRVVLVRSAAFFLFAAAYWALLPVLVRTSFGAGAELYGMLVSAIGAGAVIGALVLPRISPLLGGADGLVRAGSLGPAAAMVVLGLVPNQTVALIAGFGAGVAWILTLSSVNVAAQAVLPDWVRGRGLSIYGLVFAGCMTIGSIVWGTMASTIGIVPTFFVAAVGMVVGVVLTLRYRLTSEALDLSPAESWPQPPVAMPIIGDRGPVLVTVEYQVRTEDRDAFISAIGELKGERRRDGAYSWSRYEDVAQPERFVETFIEASWTEHMRHHARLTRADADVQEAVRRFHSGPDAPRVTHLLTTGA